jgi:hypothetical protein
MGGMIDALDQARDVEAPEEADDDAALFAKLKGWVVAGERHWSEWAKEARQCFGLIAGDHFEETDKQKMIDDGRQPVTFNRAGPIVDAICGLEVNGRQEVVYKPRTEGDAKPNEMLTALGQWARDVAMAEDEESDAFRDAVICGIGCTDTRMDYETEPQGVPAIDRVDPIEAKFDPAAKKPNAIDRRYAWRIRSMPAEEAKAMLPGHEAVTLNAAWAANAKTTDGGEGNKVDYPEETRDALKTEANPKDVTLVEIEWFDTIQQVMIAQPGEAEPQVLGVDEAKAACERLDALGIPYTKAKTSKRVYRRAVLGAVGIIEQTERDGFRLHFITGKRDRNKRCWYGMGRPMRDPSLLANKVLTQILSILNSNAKGGLMYEEGAFTNARQAAKDWSNPSKNIPLQAGGLSKIQERTAPQMPTTLTALLEMAINAIPDVTGVNTEMMGLADRDQPASLEYQRRQSAVTILAPLFDSLRRYRKEQGLALLRLLRKLTPGTLVRITQDVPTGPGMGHNGGPEMRPQEVYAPFDPVMFGLDDEAAQYDVIVDQAPSAPSQKEATWSTLTQLLSQGIQVPPAAMAELVKYSPLPSSVADKLSEILRGGEGGVSPEMQQMMDQAQQAVQALQQQLQQAGARVAELEQAAVAGDLAKAADQSKLDVDRMKAETDRLKAMADVVASGMVIAPDGSVYAMPKPEAEVPEMPEPDDERENEALAAVGQGLAMLAGAMAEQSQVMADAIVRAAAAANVPKRLVRDEAGRAVGVVPVEEVE